MGIVLLVIGYPMIIALCIIFLWREGYHNQLQQQQYEQEMIARGCEPTVDYALADSGGFVFIEYKSRLFSICNHDYKKMKINSKFGYYQGDVCVKCGHAKDWDYVVE